MIPPSDVQPPVATNNWSTTFGILAIVFGILGLLTSALQVAQTAMMKAIAPQMMTVPPPPAGNGGNASSSGNEAAIQKAVLEASTQMFNDMAEIGKIKIWVDGVLALLGAVLFIGGILLLQRYRISKVILLSWSYAKLIFGLWGAVLTQKLISKMGGSMGAMFNEQMSSLPGGSSSPPLPVDFEKIYGIMGNVTLVFGAIWLAILPVLLLIWLNRQDIKEDMTHGYGWK